MMRDSIPTPNFDVDLLGPGFREPEMQAILVALRRGALAGAEWIRGTWVEVAERMNIRSSGDYIAGIRAHGQIKVVQESLTEAGDVDVASWDITIDITNTAPHASIVEDGHAAFHLPDKINWGAMGGRIKRTDEGVAYLHIPFRHSAYASPSARADQGLTGATLRRMMPHKIYEQAKQLTHTRPLNEGNQYRSVSLDGTKHQQYMARDRYHWGDRLNRAGTRPMFIFGPPGKEAGHEEHRGSRLVGRDAEGNPLINPAWGNSKFHGMFRSGTPGHSQYMTIRTLTENSPGWNIPAQAGLGIARRVASHAQSSTELSIIIESGIQSVFAGGF